MPLSWQDPEVALTHRGVRVYHTYKDDDIENRNEYWYSFYMAADDGEFDVRNLVGPELDGNFTNEEGRRRIIRMAIEHGILAVPDDCVPECPHENLCIDRYIVDNAAATVELDRDSNTGEVFGLQFNRLDGEVKEPEFYCEDCGETFTWEQVQGF